MILFLTSFASLWLSATDPWLDLDGPCYHSQTILIHFSCSMHQAHNPTNGAWIDPVIYCHSPRF